MTPGQKKRLSLAAIPQAGSPTMERSRRPAVDWFYRGAWILVGFLLMAQFGIMIWLSQ